MNYLDNLIEELYSFCIRELASGPITADETITVDSDVITVDSDVITVD